MENYLGKDFDSWVDMWDKAQNDDEFKKQSKKANEKPLDNVDFFGQQRYAGEEVEDVDASSSDSEYWKKIYRMSSNGDAPDPLADENQVITEDGKQIVNPRPVKPNLSDKEMGDVAKSAGNSANPISPSSVGKDQNYKPNFADVYQLESLVDLKTNLHELECKLNAGDSLGKSKQGQKIQKQIDEMRKKIDDLSDSITPNFLQSYLS